MEHEKMIVQPDHNPLPIIHWVLFMHEIVDIQDNDPDEIASSVYDIIYVKLFMLKR